MEREQYSNTHRQGGGCQQNVDSYRVDHSAGLRIDQRDDDRGVHLLGDLDTYRRTGGHSMGEENSSKRLNLQENISIESLL